MQITSKKENGQLIISVSGKIDTVTSPELEKYIDENISGVNKLIFDLKDMSYTSSAGLRIFLKAQKTMNKQGSMKIINVQSDVMDVFELSGFTKILTIE